MKEYIKNEIFKNYKEIVTVNELRTMLNIGRNTAYRLISENKIQYVKVKNKIYIPKHSVVNFMLESEVTE